MGEESYLSEPLQKRVRHPSGTDESYQAPMMASTSDLHLVAQLRSGDEAAFSMLIDQYYTPMLQLASAYVAGRMVAEEVVQETWMAVLEGVGHFQGRSSLKTWMFRILTNRAKTRAQREGRSLPFSSFPDIDMDQAEPTVDPDRFQRAGQEWPGHWASFPADWRDLPEQRLLSQETQARLKLAIAELPPTQREIIVLRDVEGWTAQETCLLLGISEGNQRVLLHRARSRVRAALETYFEEGEGRDGQ